MSGGDGIGGRSLELNLGDWDPVPRGVLGADPEALVPERSDAGGRFAALVFAEAAAALDSLSRNSTHSCPKLCEVQERGRSALDFRWIRARLREGERDSAPRCR